MKKFKGFTLIELLIVVAIIGMLSAVVLSSLGGARAKAANAKKKAELSQLRAQAEIYADSNTANSNMYSTSASSAASTSCTAANTVFADPKFASIITSVTGTICDITTGGTSWAVYAPLTGDATHTGWCVDSQGDSKGLTGAAPSTISATTC